MIDINDPTSREGRIGIIDIGSNSVRFVVYDRVKRTPMPLFNEKALCILGKGLALTGKLNPEGVRMAEATLTRFLTLAKVMDVVELHVIATAAVRDASDGQAFVDRLEHLHGIDITIISGKREARLGAYGICASIHQPDGITGDLGGGSMELVHLDGYRIHEQATLPIGHLRLMDETKGDKKALRALVEENFAQLPWLKQKKLANFYGIGGSFRALAKAHMVSVNYPLKVLHEYTVNAKDFLDFLQRVSKMDEQQLQSLPGLATKRIPLFMPAAVVLENVIQVMKPEQVVFSASGIREGFLYEKLSPYVRDQDPLISSANDLAILSGRKSRQYGQELFQWMSPLFPKEKDSEERVRLAGCLISEVAWGSHPEYRAESAFTRALHSALVGISHQDRVKLSLALFYRHQAKSRDDIPVLKLLGERERLWARLFGIASSLAYNLTGGVPGSLGDSPLKASKTGFQLGGDISALQGEPVRKRLESLNEVFALVNK